MEKNYSKCWFDKQNSECQLEINTDCLNMVVKDKKENYYKWKIFDDNEEIENNIWTFNHYLKWMIKSILDINKEK